MQLPRAGRSSVNSRSFLDWSSPLSRILRRGQLIPKTGLGIGPAARRMSLISKESTGNSRLPYLLHYCTPENEIEKSLNTNGLNCPLNISGGPSRQPAVRRGRWVEGLT